LDYPFHRLLGIWADANIADQLATRSGGRSKTPKGGDVTYAETCPADLMQFAERLGDVATDILRAMAASPRVVEIKTGGGLVTDADVAVERAVRAEIERVYPTHGIIGEEFPSVRAEAEFVWIIDPLDGTKAYVQGLPLFGFLLALTWRGRIILGLAEQPLLRDRWLGAAGRGTTRNGRAVRTRACPTLAEGMISTMGYDSYCPQHNARLLPLRYACHQTVTADSFYVFGLLAAGQVDLIATACLSVYDFAPLQPIVQNAGGIMVDWDGRAITTASTGTILAAGDAALVPQAFAIMGLPLADKSS
jgi:inositol-phosphate phosphatase/L-galactose 1-phosphate phosphatase/histidinol-phosphatase